MTNLNELTLFVPTYLTVKHLRVTANRMHKWITFHLDCPDQHHLLQSAKLP